MKERTVAEHELPHDLYRAEQVRELDRIAIEDFSILGITLMERAGGAAFKLMRWRWSRARDITVLCGTGNNGGDGFVVARLAQESGLTVRVLQLGDPQKIRGDARTAMEAYLTAGGAIEPYKELPDATDLIVDGVLGTGLEREVKAEWAQALEAVNSHPAPVIALDIPSGLHSDRGSVLGSAVKADTTITFIGLKQGLFLGEGPELCGRVYFNSLDVPSEVYAPQTPSARRMDWRQQSSLLIPRSRTAHKGSFGHVLVIGGEQGYSGAARMAAEAAARTGAGLVSVATRPEHAAVLNMGRPELMCHGVSEPADLAPLLERATVIAIGPGIGQSEWALELLKQALESPLPLVVDADALNLLAEKPQKRDHWILTPHPGEAARLLGCGTGEIQGDRMESVQRLQQQFGGVVVLKGAGTLVCVGEDEPVTVCSEGNPGMASGGMGDVLTGVIAALHAQGHSAAEAARMGVALHAAAADRAAQQGERGLLATDLMPEIRALMIPLAAS